MAISINNERLHSLNVTSVLERAFKLYYNNFKLIFLLHLVFTLISGLSFGLLFAPMYASCFLICSRLLDADKEDTPELKDVFQVYNFFIPSTILGMLHIFSFLSVFFVLYFLMLLEILLGFILLFSFLFIQASLLLSFGLPLLALEKIKSPIDAAKISIEIFKSSYKKLLPVFFISLLISWSGYLFFGIGYILTAPYWICTHTILFHDVFSDIE